MATDPRPDEGSLAQQRRALQLAAEAQALPRNEQEAFLAQACGDDQALLRVAAGLLARINDASASDEFLSQPAAEFAEPLVRAVQVAEERSREFATASVQRALEGRFALGEEVGRGGSAVVYRARDLRHHRQVAVKIVIGDETAAANSQRFMREIAIAARLQHPYILPLLDSGRADGALFYVMPFVEGETLRHRLERERILSVEHTLSLASDVAEALDAAHAVGVVHRDIKPSNILLEQSHAVVADFGIALALESSATRMTATGMVIGTPHYMSPEQAAGDQQIDARSDVYSLGCVVYEMLAGEVPFPGGSVQAVRAKHMHAAVPDVSILRPSLPATIGPVITRALAKSPTDRFPSAGAFVEALRHAVAETVATPAPGPRTVESLPPPLPASAGRARLIGAALAVAATIALVFAAPKLPWSRQPVAVDPLAIVLFPFERHGEVPATLGESGRLRDAMRLWRDLRLVDAPTLDEALAGVEGAALPLTMSQRVAQSLGAGRFVRGSVSGDRESIWLRAMLYQTGTARMEGEASVRVPASLPEIEAAFDRLVTELLFREQVERLPRAVRIARPGTSSYVAYRHFLDAQLAAASWDLDRADSSFARATQADRDFRQAWLWLGLTRRWNRRETALWRGAAQQAGHGSTPLGSRDSALAVALLASAEGDVPTACRTLRALTTRAPDDFAAWYGSADCMGRDSVVVRDPRSPTGWRFRHSRHTAIENYRRAFLLMPSIMRGLRANGFSGARTLFQVSRSIMVRGIALPPDTMRFSVFPAVAGDSLVHLPVPLEESQRRADADVSGGQADGIGDLARAYDAARLRQRRLFREVAAAWVAESHNAESYEALGTALQWLGDPAAFDTLERARTLAADMRTRANVTATSVVVGLLLGAPDDSTMLARTVALADTLLADSAMVASDPRSAVTIAALTGRAFRAARIAARWPGDPSQALVPRARPLAERIFIFGIVGGPVDSLQLLEPQMDALLQQQPDAGPRDRLVALRRPAVLALPNYRMHALQTLVAGRDALLDATQAMLRGDSARTRERLRFLQDLRRDLAREDLTFDALFTEAYLWQQLGEVPAAIATLDPTLTALPRVSLGLADPAYAVSLVRAMALRAELAAQVGDRATARRWARAVVTLWRGADAFLQPTVRRMRSLMS